jgi:large subunit ribosomal protein L9
MKVILKQDVDKLGRRGDVVNVAPGFGRNFLIPRKMALAVTPTNVKMIEIERQALKKKLEAERKTFQSLAQKLSQVSLTFTRRAGEKDVIFGSVSSGDIKDALAGLGYDIDKKKILLDEPIKRLGNFSVPVKISMDDRAEVKVVVAREEAEGTDVSAADGKTTEDQATGKT